MSFDRYRVTRTVVLLGSYAPSLVNFRGSLIADIVAKGHKVYALAPEIDEETGRKLRSLGAEPMSVMIGRTSLNPLTSWRSGRALKALFRRIQPDVVIAYTIKPILLGAAAARSAGVGRFVALITGMGYAFLGGLQPKRIIIRLIAMFMYRRALALSHFAIFQNPDDQRDFERLRLLPRTLGRGLIHGSGVDLEVFESRPVPSKPAFLMIARFLKDKGIREFAAAARALKQDFPHVRIMLVGWVDESPDSISQVELDRIVAGGVEYLGQLTDVRPALESCSVYVLPSYREGTPRSVLEALAVGRAVITSDAPGCRETVADGINGFLISPKDVSGLYAAMRRFVQQPELAVRMGQESRRIAEEKYDVKKVNRKIMNYASL